VRIEHIRNGPRPAACRRLAAVLTIAVALLLPAGAATAAPTLRLSFPIDATFPADGLTALCGVPVWIHFEGEDQVTYFYDASGTQILRERDYSPGFKFTIYSPIEEGGTGQTFTYPSSVQLHVDYPDGTTVGSQAIITVTGLSGFAAPGVAGAGRSVFEGVVFDTSDGLPHLDWPTAVLSVVGSFNRDVDPLAARCAVLNGS
jgi:hypothetical protein